MHSNRMLNGKATRLATCFALACLVHVGGCIEPLAPEPTDDWSPTLVYVVENQEEFRQDPEHPLADIKAGVVMDDLETLDGCWGAFEVFPTVFGTPFLSDWEAYVFDRENERIEWWVVGQAVFPHISGGARAYFTATFSVVADDMIEITHAEREAPTRRFVTLSGDSMKIRWVREDPEEEDERDALVFQRFDCPEE